MWRYKMHIFLSTLAGLTIAGSTLSPALFKNDNRLAQNQAVSPQQSSIMVDMETNQQLNATQGYAMWSWEFYFHDNKEIDRIEFLDGPLTSKVSWGSSHWSYTFPYLEIQQGQLGNWVTLYKDEHWDFLASQSSLLQYKLTRMGSSNYKLEFNYLAESYNSFSSCTGNLTIGRWLSVISNS